MSVIRLDQLTVGVSVNRGRKQYKDWVLGHSNPETLERRGGTSKEGDEGVTSMVRGESRESGIPEAK